MLWLGLKTLWVGPLVGGGGLAGGAAGCLLLVALALYVVDLFQWCDVETERKLGGVEGKITG